VYTNGLAVDAAGLRGPFTNSHPAQLPLPYVCLKGNFLMHSSTLYRARHKQVFLGLIPPVLDWGIHLAFAREGPLGFIDEPLAMYRVATATSTIQNAYPWVEELLWEALVKALPALDPREQSQALGHIVAHALLASVAGKTASARPLIARIAAEAHRTPRSLIRSALPHAMRIAAYGAVRVAGRRLRLARSLVEHYRV
jgi:hypothetical protein